MVKLATRLTIRESSLKLERYTMKTYEKLYDILSQADDYVNGEKNSPRPRDYSDLYLKAIQKLEKEGIQIESVKNRGYRLLDGDLLLPS